MTLNTIAIEESLDALVSEVSTGTCSLNDFPFRLMEAYAASRNEVAKLRMKHPSNLLGGDVLWPKKMLYRPAGAGQVQNVIASLQASLVRKKGAAAKNAPRFIISTDGEEFLAVDVKTGETPSFDRMGDLPVNYDFLLPMFGVERYKPAPETAADVRAARHMAKFHDAIREANPLWGQDRIHDLNIFMTRLLFCMFAEDTGIFPNNLFVSALRREAMQIDGSDTKRVIEDIFIALDIEYRQNRLNQGVRSQRIAADFPYVNGGLFRDRTEIPAFNRKARRLLLEAADLQWDQIHADIFGSMIQAIVQTDMRADFGMHYTSVPNIMKVLDPLFLNSLREQLTAAGDNVKALEKLLDRISRIRVFDPACGSGNFLIIAYRELRIIETEAFRRIRDVKRKGQLALADFQTGIKISNFYGIDPVDFACETAKLSLWISQYQMNKKLDEICSTPIPALPLSDAGNIRVGNALRLDWMKLCPPSIEDEVYIVGNPPYLGSVFQTAEQKEDMRLVFAHELKTYKDLDYVAAWYRKAADYCGQGSGAAAFVATNSICQGEQVAMLWPLVFSSGVEIQFAHRAFKWKNNAKNVAGVTCVIVGIKRQSNGPKIIYSHETSLAARNIGPYLVDMPNLWVQKRSSPISSLPQMVSGNKATDGGRLILSSDERAELLRKHPEASKFIRRLCGAEEFINGSERWCLWIEDEDLQIAKTIPALAKRFMDVAASRAASRGKQANDGVLTPHKFIFRSHESGQAILIPSVSSETRKYIPCGFLSDDTVIVAPNLAVYKAPVWLFSVLVTKLHALWAKTVGGRLETRIRYSNTLVYNTFPLPDLSAQQKEELEDQALDILRLREPHIADGKTIAWLYNPETMPADLLKAHRDLDDYLETIYLGRPFNDDTERLSHLFKLYARMTKSAVKSA